MSSAEFSADWLDLREPADHRARAVRLTRAVADALPQDRTVRALDLASGTGSNVRYLSEYVRGPQDWLLADHSASLLGVAQERLGDRINTRVVDLMDLAGHADMFAGRALVTASALVDLVSESWLRRALVLCRDAGAMVLFALSYDGRMVCTPEEPEDALVRDLVNAHQRTDKGFGPALGPTSPDCTMSILEGLGYEVRSEPSDWILGAGESELQRLLIDGWAQAAAEMAPERETAIASWRVRRLDHVDAGASRVLVGHQDVAAFPGST